MMKLLKIGCSRPRYKKSMFLFKKYYYILKFFYFYPHTGLAIESIDSKVILHESIRKTTSLPTLITLELLKKVKKLNRNICYLSII